MTGRVLSRASHTISTVELTQPGGSVGSKHHTMCGTDLRLVAEGDSSQGTCGVCTAQLQVVAR